MRSSGQIELSLVIPTFNEEGNVQCLYNEILLVLKQLQISTYEVIFIDDVLFTGRSIRSALTAIQSFGRPSEIELLVLIDRRFSRNLPIQPDYRGRQVDAINNEKVKVCWKENDGEDGVYLITN